MHKKKLKESRKQNALPFESKGEGVLFFCEVRINH